MRLKDKVALVTGAAQGIGREYALALAAEGARVVVADIKADKARSVAGEIKALGREAIGASVDVADENSVKQLAARAVQEFGGIDILVNNAAIYEGMVRSTLLEVDWEYLARFMNVNFYGVLLCARAVVPFMKQRSGGKIINQASIAAYNTVSGFYGLSKAGVVALTMRLARELGPYNITINAIAPGAINTDATLGLMTSQGLEKYASQQPLKSVGRPRDLVGTLLFLASSDSDWMTGQTLIVDGGLTPRY